MQQQNGTPAAPPSEDSTAQALEEYLEAAEAGTAPPREQFLARYPELAENLDACLAALRFIGHAASQPGVLAPGNGLIAASQPGVLAPGDGLVGQLGDFRILREVGRGGMGIVYEAEQVSLGRRVALKVLPFAATMDPRQLQRFHNEARAAASLDHPHIVHVHAVGCERAVHFYAMQFIDGQTLAAMIADLRRAGGRPVPTDDQPTTTHSPAAPTTPAPDTVPRAAASTERGPLDRAHFRRVAELGIQAAEALDHAHTLGIVHRDVKPANLLVAAEPGASATGVRLWVTDFGLAHIQSDARLTMTGDLVGTLRYMSPEQALAKRVVVDHRTDVYSLGATLYELLTLEPAFTGNDRQELLRQIAFEEPKTPRRINRTIPAELETIVLKAMEKNPAERYATAKELAEDLQRWLADEPIRAKRAGVVRRLRKWGRRHRAAVTAAAALLLAVMVLGGVVVWRELGQRAAAEHSVEAALDRADLLQQQERWDEALAVLTVAQGQMEGRGLPALRRRVEQSRRDVEMLIKLEDAHLQAAASGKETGFDYAGADRLYARAFADYGLDLTILSNTEYAARVRASAICERLITALDGWAFVREKLQLGSGGDLWSVADLADDDAWRPRLRAVVRRWDRTALEELAQEGGAPSNLSANQTLLAISLAQAGSWAMAERLLRQVQAARPGDFWINFQLALTLRQKKSADRAGAIRFVQAALALRPQSPVVHNNLGILLYEKKDVDGAIAESREAIRLKKDFPEAHGNLGNALYDKGDTDGAIAELREAIQLNKDLPEAHNNLGIALEAKGDLDGAIDEYRRAIEIDPKFALPHANLGHLLYAKKEVAGAIAEFRRAIDLDPKFALAHTNLGSALYDNKDVDGAIAEYKKAIDSDPNFALAHYDLAVALDGKQDVDGAIAEYKKAIDINPKYANAHNNLGNDLGAKGNLDEAIAEYKKAIDSYPKHAVAHNGLGVALAAKGDLAGAIAAFHKAIELVPKYANAHNNLRQALVLRKLPAILKGEAQAAGTAERLDLAVVCATPPKKLYAAAARFYAGAFAADPKLAADLQQQHRYNAACSAALAAAGQGEDARQLPDKVQRMLRRQALVWLRDDLALYGKLAEREEPAAKQIVRQLLGHWPEDTDLVSIRDRDALAKLPEAERKDWQKLWADVAETLARAQGKTAPEQKPGVK